MRYSSNARETSAALVLNPQNELLYYASVSTFSSVKGYTGARL